MKQGLKPQIFLTNRSLFLVDFSLKSSIEKSWYFMHNYEGEANSQLLYQLTELLNSRTTNREFHKVWNC